MNKGSGDTPFLLEGKLGWNEIHRNRSRMDLQK